MEYAILGYACKTPRENHPREFFENLIAPKLKNNAPSWPFTWGVPLDPSATDQSLAFLTDNLMACWQSLKTQRADRLGGDGQTSEATNTRLGVILASTKGCIDDYVWHQADFLAHRQQDPVTSVLRAFLTAAGLSPVLSICVSNACASSLSALFLAEQWLAQKRVDEVLVLACDRIGPFATQGFQCLQVVTQTYPKPFAEKRDGLTLGEAAAAILLGRQTHSGEICIRAVGIDTEGYAVTRPSPSGESIKRVYRSFQDKQLKEPDVVIAHGTGTELNDAAEERAFSDLFEKRVAITGTKWLTGHTLGTSGLMDVIAAIEMFHAQEAFTLATTRQVDSSFRARYLTSDAEARAVSRRGIQNVLVSSLGFGGVHALAQLSLGGVS